MIPNDFFRYFFKLFSKLTLVTICSSSFSNDLPVEEIHKIEGAYKKKYTSSNSDGKKNTIEDIVEIVKYSNDEIYFRLELYSYNNNGCSIYGIAKFENNSFIYKERIGPYENDTNKVCGISISRENESLVVTSKIENNNGKLCEAPCGVWIDHIDYKISMDKRRKIKYMPLILKSIQYDDAVYQYHKIGR